MKESIRRIFADCFIVFGILCLVLVTRTLRYFNIVIVDDTNVSYAIFAIPASVCLFIGCNITPVKLLFPKSLKIKWGLLLVFISLITVTQCFDEVLEFFLHSNSVVNYFSNHKFTFGLGMFVKNKFSLTFFVIAVFIVPFLEEFVFRFFLYGKMKVRYESVPIAILLSSLIFSYLHIFEGYNFPQLVIIFFHGILFSYIFEKTGSILSSIILHSFNNAIATLTASLLWAYEVVFSTLLVTVSFLVLLSSLIIFIVRKIFAKRLSVPQSDDINLELSDTTTTPSETESTTTIEETAQIKNDFLD